MDWGDCQCGSVACSAVRAVQRSADRQGLGEEITAPPPCRATMDSYDAILGTMHWM